MKHQRFYFTNSFRTKLADSFEQEKSMIKYILIFFPIRVNTLITFTKLSLIRWFLRLFRIVSLAELVFVLFRLEFTKIKCKLYRKLHAHDRHGTDSKKKIFQTSGNCQLNHFIMIMSCMRKCNLNFALKYSDIKIQYIDQNNRIIAFRTISKLLVVWELCKGIASFYE